MTTLIVYRGARCCGRLGCSEVLDRYGRCPDCHTSGSVWVDDAEEIELDVEADISFTRQTASEPGGTLVEDLEATVDGFDFTPLLTDDEKDDAERELLDHSDGGAFGPDYDDSKDDERDWA